MKRFVWSCVAMLVAMAGTAQADYTFTFSDSSGDTGFGTLNTTVSGWSDGSVWATGGSLTVTGGALAGNTYSLLSGGPGQTFSPSGSFVFDNLLYPNNDAGGGVFNGVGFFANISNPSFLDNGGIVFTDGTGTEVNIWGNGGGDYAFVWVTSPGAYQGSFSGATFTATAVPEPTSFAMLGLGALTMAGFHWLRRKPTVNMA